MVTASAEDGSCSRGHRAVCSAAMQTALRCLEGRWKMMILAHLFREPVMRFSELQRAIPGVSQKMLIQQLRELERHEILRREVHPEVPPKVEYSLTDIGKALGPVFRALLDWPPFAPRLRDPWTLPVKRVNIGCSAACLPAALSAGIVGDYPKTSTALRPARLSALSPAGIMPHFAAARPGGRSGDTHVPR